MPTYQYACTACGERLEAVQSFTDAPLTECPACSGALRKVFSAVGVVFKGSGFYKTDSRGKAPSSGDSTPAAGSGAAAKAPATTESSSTPAATTTSSTPASKTA
ncbi:MAG: FmdB family transcriptional regulator [Frankiales bacterium]|nr:MAG: FmdB family transcriptional regulator [Frankiales bacterium]